MEVTSHRQIVQRSDPKTPVAAEDEVTPFNIQRIGRADPDGNTIDFWDEFPAPIRGDSRKKHQKGLMSQATATHVDIAEPINDEQAPLLEKRLADVQSRSPLSSFSERGITFHSTIELRSGDVLVGESSVTR
jgi:hypothetical protein